MAVFLRNQERTNATENQKNMIMEIQAEKNNRRMVEGYGYQKKAGKHRNIELADFGQTGSSGAAHKKQLHTAFCRFPGSCIFHFSGSPHHNVGTFLTAVQTPHSRFLCVLPECPGSSHSLAVNKMEDRQSCRPLHHTTVPTAHARSQLSYLPLPFQSLSTLLLPSSTLTSQIPPQNGSHGNASCSCKTANP